MIRNGTTCKHEGIAGGRAAVTEVIAVGIINIAYEMEMVGSGWKWRQGRVLCQRFQWDMGDSMIRRGTPVNKTPVNGGPKILGNIFFETEVMEFGGFDSKFC
jgi:hypothetical protein